MGALRGKGRDLCLRDPGDDERLFLSGNLDFQAVANGVEAKVAALAQVKNNPALFDYQLGEAALFIVLVGAGTGQGAEGGDHDQQPAGVEEKFSPIQ